MRTFLAAVAAVGIVLTTGTFACAADPAPGISEDGFVAIGGIDQWVSVHGASRANPVIVVVHGGPGVANSALRTFYRAWESDFTVVQWDQRGAGKTFGRGGKSTPDVTLDQIVQDGIDIADYARRRFGKKHVLLVGHSWGSYVGVTMIRKRPDLFSAYVGTGQVVSFAQTMSAQYAYDLTRAQADANPDALAELRQNGPPPYEIGPKFFALQKWNDKYLSPEDAQYLAKQSDVVRAAPNISPQEVQDWNDGRQFSLQKLVPALVAMDLPATQGYDMPVPFFIIDGEDDWTTPATLAQKYFASIRAPQKRLVLIRGAGHFSYATNGAEFLNDLVRYVRPLALQRES